MELGRTSFTTHHPFELIHILMNSNYSQLDMDFLPGVQVDAEAEAAAKNCKY